jgi:hypothetical protein
MMHVDPICACIHAYHLRTLNKLSIAINNFTSTNFSHAMRWTNDEDHHVKIKLQMDIKHYRRMHVVENR